ncbi:MAG: hypothetical protein K0U47_04000 [Epsilonproteobacteria bacterium]|nr:hypothetical protein [Campylobacterota bacterium]
MKYYKFILLLLLTFFLSGCERKIDLGVHEVHWDRDMCVRCKMVVSERFYAAQTTDPTTGRTYYFDDIGCLVLWFQEDQITWADSAFIWVTDVKSGVWINAKEAKWTTLDVTPMAFGFAAYTPGTEPDGVEVIAYEEMARRAIVLEARKKRL